MLKKVLAIAFAVLVLGVGSASAAMVVNYGWEDGNTILGNYQPITATNVSSPVHSGNSSLQLIDGGVSTPQAFVGWVTGLSAGDTVTASFWAYDTTPGTSPSGRIWGHYTDNDDIDSYNGSASGNYDYGDGTGWSFLEWTWTIASDGGLVIEARTYSNLGDTVYIDDLTISAPDYATIHTAGGTTSPVPVPAAVWMLGSGLVGLVGLRRKQR